MTSTNSASSFDPSQFKLQPDGTFRISIRGMAAMAGVNDTGLGRSLKSITDAYGKPRPIGRALLANDLGGAKHGLCPKQCKVILLHLIRTNHPSAHACSLALRALEEHFDEARNFSPIIPMRDSAVPKRAASSYLYIMQSLDTSFYKIGITSSIERRLEDLRCAHGDSLQLICSLKAPNALGKERKIHAQLKEYNRSREWFCLPPSVFYRLIDSLKASDKFTMHNEPFIPISSIRTMDDVYMLSHKGLFPLAVDTETQAHDIDWLDNEPSVDFALINEEHDNDTFHIQVRYDDNKNFVHYSWYLYQTYTGGPIESFCPQADVRQLRDPERLHCRCHQHAMAGT